MIAESTTGRAATRNQKNVSSWRVEYSLAAGLEDTQVPACPPARNLRLSDGLRHCLDEKVVFVIEIKAVWNTGRATSLSVERIEEGSEGTAERFWRS